MRLFALALAAATAGFSPLRAEEPRVREGNERVAAGQPAAALPRYDAAERAVGPRAEIDYDRGVALQRLGRYAEAADAYRRALARGAGALSSRAQQNLGTALAAAGDREGAIAAFTEALRADPANEDARFDLEVLLRRRAAEARRTPAPARGAPAPQAQRGTGEEAAKPEAGGPRPRAKAPDAQPAPPAPRAPAEEQGASDAEAGRLTQEEAARILDAFRTGERPLPLTAAERRRTRRGDAARDW